MVSVEQFRTLGLAPILLALVPGLTVLFVSVLGKTGLGGTLALTGQK